MGLIDMVDRWRRLSGAQPPSDVTLVGRHAYLRPPRLSDWREWAVLRDQSRAFLVPWEPLWPRDSLSKAAYHHRLRRYARDWRTGHCYSFFIFARENDALVGAITLSNVRRGVTQSGSLGYWIGARYSRNGYMFEAVQCVLDFAFEQLGLHRVEAACLPSNTASAGLLRKSGFQQEGLARRYLRINGAWQDHVLFGVLREDRRPRPYAAEATRAEPRAPALSSSA